MASLVIAGLREEAEFSNVILAEWKTIHKDGFDAIRFTKRTPIF